MIRFFPKPPNLWDVKCCAGKSHFNERTVEVRCGGVEKRADQVPGQFNRKAVKTDRDQNGWDRAANGPGPVEQRLNSFGTVRGLVFGPRGESSKDVERLISASAAIGGERRWRELGARSAVEAKAFIKYKMREAFGITAIRASAMVKRECLGIVLGNASGGEARRKSANLFRKRMHQDYYSTTLGGLAGALIR